MKQILTVCCLFLMAHAIGQDSTMNSLTMSMDSSSLNSEKKPVKIFNSYRTINANTTEVTGKGKMDFNVTHNFGDIGGHDGGIKHFFGMDGAMDVRIGFNIGIGKHTDLIAARAKGASLEQLWQLGIKQQIMQQLENDPGHPISMALFADGVMYTGPESVSVEGALNTFPDFSDRFSGILQLIVARKMGKISIQLNPTYSFRTRALDYDQKNFFALGGAIRLPLGNRFNLVLDYFHTFRDQASKDSVRNIEGFKFHDVLGVGFEIITAGHVFHLNFTNATEILENRFIPRTVTSWSKGQFRWGFTISRTFVLWRDKN